MNPIRRPVPCIRLLAAALVLGISSPGIASLQSAVPAVQRGVAGQTAQGTVIEVFTLTNSHGASARILTHGATLADLQMPDRSGKLAPMVIPATGNPGPQGGYSNAGSVMGRVTNRIALGRFTLDGTPHQIATNAGKHTLHGGRRGFNRVDWRGEIVSSPAGAAVRLSYVSPDGEEGFPGQLTTSVTYTLTADNVLRLDYEASTDRATPVNLTNHAYFNLRSGGDVLDHQLTLFASKVTAADADLIPTGAFTDVTGTALDFRKPQALGARVALLAPARRYDHNFVLDRRAGDTSLALAARIQDPVSGRAMEVWTTEPALQLYTNVLAAPAAGESASRAGFYCFETQHNPDSVNHPNFPSTILRPGMRFRSTTEFRFSAK